MYVKCCCFCAALLCAVEFGQAQGRRDTAALAAPSAAPTDNQPAADPAAPGGGAKWRTPSVASRNISSDTSRLSDSQPPIRPVGASVSRQPIARVTPGPTSLPSDAGQEWRDYDISPYTARVTSTNRPEQAILDWVLRETGYEAWHSETLSFLHADHRTLHVYHTPEMHAVVAEMVDRFVNTEGESQAFGVRVITLTNPNWRTKAHPMLHPVTTQTPAIQAWLLAKEDAALLQADLRRRSDFQEHSTPHLLVNNGQSTVISKTKPRNYVRDVILKSTVWPGFEPQMSQFQEGFTLEFNPLLSLNGKDVDAVIKCEIDQVEQMIKVDIPVPTAVAPRQRTTIEVPQMISSRLHERFRWPADQVLLISLGVGPTPVSPPPNSLGIKLPMISPATRADLLVFVDNKGKVSSQPSAISPGQPAATAYRDRYGR